MIMNYSKGVWSLLKVLVEMLAHELFIQCVVVQTLANEGGRGHSHFLWCDVNTMSAIIVGYIQVFM